MTDDDLSFLLCQSRDNNAPDAITGMLLYMEGRFIDRTEGRFIQLMEGPEANVRAMFKTIRGDERHKGIVLLETGNYPARNFPDWSMGFEPTDKDTNEMAAGYFELTEGSLESHLNKKPAEALNYLKTFYNINKVDWLANKK